MVAERHSWRTIVCALIALLISMLHTDAARAQLGCQTMGLIKALAAAPVRPNGSGNAMDRISSLLPRTAAPAFRTEISRNFASVESRVILRYLDRLANASSAGGRTIDPHVKAMAREVARIAVRNRCTRSSMATASGRRPDQGLDGKIGWLLLARYGGGDALGIQSPRWSVVMMLIGTPLAGILLLSGWERNQRRARRFHCAIPSNLSGAFGTFPVVMRNVSQGGCLMETDRPISVGCRVTVTALGRTFEGSVIWIKACHTGISFTRTISDAERSALLEDSQRCKRAERLRRRPRCTAGHGLALDAKRRRQ